MPLIEVQGLTKLYRMGDSVVHALDGVDLTIERGEFVAITGASGSGKSTIMHLLGCLDRPTAGIYRLDGRDVNGLSDHELATVRNRQIGFVFQTFNLINRTTAWENVAVPLFYARKTSMHAPSVLALARVGLAARAAHQPNELSGGERQRVAIARAIVNDPLLLLADEPTGNLDSRTGEQIMQIVRALNEQGVTIIIVTHEQDIAEQAKRIVQMRDGKIVSDRLTKDILAQEGRWRPTEASPTDEPVAEAIEVEAQEEPPLEYAAMTPRMVPGATAGFASGLIAVILFALAIAAQVTLGAVYGDKLKQPDPTKMPPLPIVIGGLVATLASVASLVLAILAVVFSMGARKRMRAEIGNWLGRRRALAGLITGWAVIGVMAIGIVVSVVQAMRKATP